MKHVHEPSHYHRTLGPHPPALRVAPGDSVVTTCVDAGGRDHDDRQVTEPGNPMTGPIHVEGAVPGDVVTIRFDAIAPTRSLARSASTISPYCLEAPYLRDAAAAGREPLVAEWEVDAEAGVARLTAHASRLPGLVLPLAPMLGCFGVAPPRQQAISSATSGEHGGNMDYRGFVAGATVYFPVFVPGALFHLGDGHAVQGDGEIVGTGIEISFDVQFTVRLLKGKRIHWPRAENDTHILTAGNARPLDQALQHATSEMLAWLQADHGHDLVSASLLMSQTVRYDIGNVYNPAYTVVCRMDAPRAAEAG